MCHSPPVTSPTSRPLDITDHLGPVSFLAVEFPEGQADPAGFTRLLDLVERGLVLVIDLEFVRRATDGTLETVPVGSLDLGVDLSAFEGADSGLLDRDDLELVAASLEGDAVMAVLVYEDLVMEPVLAAWSSGGARLVAEGGVDAADLETALDAEDAGDAPAG